VTRPRPGHVPPPPGERQPGTGARTNQAGFITVQGRLFAPLQGLDSDDVLQGGYGYLDLTDGGQTYHPGADLNAGGSCNADEGLLVVAPLRAVVRALYPWDGVSMGEGSHAWLEVTDELRPGPSWVHCDHLLGFDCAEGQELAPGEVVGSCGRSGGWDCAHLHFEVLRGPPRDGYWQWPYQWPKEAVEAAYYGPRAWWDAASAKVQGARPPEVEMILSGAQAASVQAVVWGAYWDPAAADFAIQSAWRAEWRRGVWRGAPLAEEQPIPEDGAAGKPAGAFRAFEYGVCCWLPGEPVSWNG